MMGPLLLHLCAGTLATLLFVGGAAYLGPAAFFLNLFAPVPAAYVAMRVGMLPAGAVVVCSGAALWGFGGPVAALTYLLQYGVAALALALLLRRGQPWDRAAFGAVIVSLAIAALVVTVLVVDSGSNVDALVEQYVKTEIDKTATLYQDADLPAEQREEMAGFMEQVAGFLNRAWPGLLVTFCGAMLLFTVQMLAALSRGQYLVGGPPFPFWKVPELLVWPLIGAGFVAFFTTGAPATVAINLLVVLLPLYFLHGLAIISFYFNLKGISPLLRTIGYALVLLLNPLPLVVTALGVFDLWANFRKPRIKNNT